MHLRWIPRSRSSGSKRTLSLECTMAYEHLDEAFRVWEDNLGERQMGIPH